MKDVTNVTLRRPLLASHQRRSLRTASRLQQVDTASALDTEDSFVPFDRDVKQHPKSLIKAHHKSTQERSKDDLGEEWHAEIEIAAPWPQETSNAHAAVFKERDTTGNISTEITEDDSTPAAIDNASLQDVNSPPKRLEEAAEVPLPPLEMPDESTTSTTTSTLSPTRAENRQQRKIRRMQAGTYRSQAETASQGGGSKDKRCASAVCAENHARNQGCQI